MTNKEEWKIYNRSKYNLYEVSSHGRVRKNGIVWEPKTDKVYKILRVDKKIIRLHKLVAELFIPNPDNKPYVLHWDDNSLNNHIDNLRWGNASENQFDKYRNGYVAPKHSEEWIKKMVESSTNKQYGFYNGNYYTCKELSIIFNVARVTVSNWKSGFNKCPHDIIFL